MYTAHTSTLPFKDNGFQSQVPTWASTNFTPVGGWVQTTPRMQMGPSLQWKGPSRGMLLFQAPSRKPLLLAGAKINFDICLYLATAFFTAFMSKWRDTVISSVCMDTFAEIGPANRIPRRAGLVSSS